ncbi:MAG: muconolactone Delta-isomerase [Streptosporangiaceae bacterium]
MEFLVHIIIEPPDSLEPDALRRLREAEAARAAELAGSGVLLRLWREPGRWANWGLWAARDEADLDAALGSLPLRPYMGVTVHPLEAHPSDPNRSSHPGGGD